MRKYILFILLAAGFILRFAGLFFNGNQNFATYHEWGTWVRTLGLADAFRGGYGPIAYLLMGVSDYFAQFIPQIWWLPYKSVNFIFEIAILILLLKLLKKYSYEVIFLYWLNPWFLIPGSWQGFWDASFGFFILLTVVIFDFYKIKKRKFLLAGLSLGIAFCIKPQIIAPLSILGIYFIVFHFSRLKFKEVIQFIVGFSFLPVLFNLYFFLQAKSALYLFQIYGEFASYMPYLVNSEINIWHTVTYAVMSYQHMKGPIYCLDTRFFPYNIIEKGAYIVYFLLLIFYVLKTYINRKFDSSLFFLKAFTLPFILMPQILTRSHVYHFYTATLLLIPLIIIEKDRKIFILWVISVAIHFYNIYYGYGLGQSISNPPSFIPLRGDPEISILGFLQFLAILGFIYLFLFAKKNIRKSSA